MSRLYFKINMFKKDGYTHLYSSLFELSSKYENSLKGVIQYLKVINTHPDLVISLNKYQELYN